MKILYENNVCDIFVIFYSKAKKRKEALEQEKEKMNAQKAKTEDVLKSNYFGRYSMISLNHHRFRRDFRIDQ